MRARFHRLPGWASGMTRLRRGKAMQRCPPLSILAHSGRANAGQLAREGYPYRTVTVIPGKAYKIRVPLHAAAAALWLFIGRVALLEARKSRLRPSVHGRACRPCARRAAMAVADDALFALIEASVICKQTSPKGADKLLL